MFVCAVFLGFCEMTPYDVPSSIARVRSAEMKAAFASVNLTSLLSDPASLVVIACITAVVLRIIANNLPSSYPPIWEGIPFIGGIIAFLSGPLPLVHKGYTKKGEVFTVPVLHKRLTFLIGPYVTSHFFKATDEALSQEEVYKFNIPTFGPGVVYDVHHKIRGEQFRMFGDALKSDKLLQYLPLFKMETIDYFSRWAESGEVLLFDELSQLTTLTAARTLLGREIREQLFGEVAQLLHDLDAGMVPISFFFPYMPIAVHRKRDESRKRLKEIFDRVIQLRRSSGVKESDLLQTFIDSRYVRAYKGRALNDDEIGGLLIAALFAGQHTSSVTSSWTGYFLIHNREWWDRCVEEQKHVIKKYGTEISNDTLDDMPILHNCIREALRISPPLLLLMRYVKQPFTVTTSMGREYTIPKGDIVLTSPVYAGRLSQVYTSPERFDPERLMKPREEDKQMPHSYLPFGAGRHGCMGHNFALLQIKTIWSYLLRNFDFQKIDPFPQPDYDSMVVGMKPSRVAFQRRSILSES